MQKDREPKAVLGHTKLEASVGYTRPYLNNKEGEKYTPSFGQHLPYRTHSCQTSGLLTDTSIKGLP